MTTFNLHITIVPCRILAGILSVVALQGCDTVVEATMPITPSSIPQASTEVFKQKYPAVFHEYKKTLSTHQCHLCGQHGRELKSPHPNDKHLH